MAGWFYCVIFINSDKNGIACKVTAFVERNHLQEITELVGSKLNDIGMMVLEKEGEQSLGEFTDKLSIE